MKYLTAIVAAGIFSAATAYAGEVAPNDVSFEDGAVAQSLTGTPGDAAAGRESFANRKLGNCLACHENADLADLGFPGEVGPPLDGVGDRYSEAELRGLVANAKMTFDDTIMPAFYRTSGLNHVLGSFEGKTILSAQQVEDVVAYLMTLKDG